VIGKPRQLVLVGLCGEPVKEVATESSQGKTDDDRHPDQQNLSCHYASCVCTQLNSYFSPPFGVFNANDQTFS
jgi:hypothetical protein